MAPETFRRAWLLPGVALVLQLWGCCSGCRGRGWGLAAWAGSCAPHSPRHPVIWDNQRRGTGQGLSCPLFVGTVPQGADPALCHSKSIFALHWSFDLARTPCLLPSTLLYLSFPLSSSMQRSNRGLASGMLWPPTCSSQLARDNANREINSGLEAAPSCTR